MRLSIPALAITIFAFSGAAPRFGFADETKRFPFSQLTTEEAKIITPGKPLFLDFWASWCGPCKKSFPENNRLAKKFKDRVNFVAINEDRDTNEALAFLKELPLEFPNIMHNHHRLAKMLQIKALPTLMIFDANGNLALSVRGYDPADLGKIEKTLEAVSKP